MATLCYPDPSSRGKRSKLRKKAVSAAVEATAVDDAKPTIFPRKRWHEAALAPGESMCQMIDEERTEAEFFDRNERITAADERKRATAMINILRTRGGLRKLAMVPANWRDIVRGLERTFPNFIDVLDFVKVSLTLAERNDGVAHFDPILLNGPPGCGKTMFAKVLAAELGSGLLQLNMENALSNSALSGSAEFWSNTKPGELFNMLVEKSYANPVVFLDEIDKVRARECDPLSSLLSLLESGTARAFRDQSVPWVTLDASRVIWICTANDANSLPAPILDRLRRFDIPELTKQQSQAVVISIYLELRRNVVGTAPSTKLPASSVDLLTEMSSRRMRQTLKEGLGRAMLRGSKKIRPSDLMPDPQRRGQRLTRMGFLP